MRTEAIKTRISSPFEGFLYGTMLARRTVLPFVESPIEADFAVAVIDLCRAAKIDFVFTPRETAGEFRAVDLLLVPQWRLSGFRYDFMVRHKNGRAALVECDSKEFHSTEDQIANDRRKDAAVQAAGLILFRIQGSDLHYRHFDCAREVLRYVGALA